jgi:hypothetical protein
VDEFTDLNDVPSSYSGQANKVVKVNAGATGLEFGQEVHNLKVSLSAAQIKTANSVPIDIGLAASGAGYYWRVTQCNLRLNFNSVAFTSGDVSIYSTSLIGIATQQLFFSSAMSLSANAFVNGIVEQTNGSVFSENDTISIWVDADSLVGDSTADCYISVQKVKL